ncbi:MAG: hypothetical protein ACRD2N_26460 [Vicinamibacterales bacterium]
MPKRLHVTCCVALALSSGVLSQTACAQHSRTTSLLSMLTDNAFWTLSEAASEPAGTFTHSENLVSNERDFAQTIRVLRPTGGVYVGVGPEQNFSYIARLQPDMAFIIDIRRENRNLHLMYKALFEASADRADFVSRLFSRGRPAALDSQTPVQQMFAEYATVQPSRLLFDSTARLIRDRLLHTHRFPLSEEDLEWIAHAFHVFYSEGPEIDYGRFQTADPTEPSYSVLMTAQDFNGQSRSYLATEVGFAFVKDLHARNLIVPVVGDFSGPTSIRGIGDYVRQHGARLTAFYSSNVEVYLNRDQTARFCASLTTLPHDGRSWFIANKGVESFGGKLSRCAPDARRP